MRSSADNWSRPPAEVSGLFTLLRRHLLTQTHRCLEQSIRINVIGRRDRLYPSLLQSIERSERHRRCSGMHLRIAIDYSAQHKLLEAVAVCSWRAASTRRVFSNALPRWTMPAVPTPAVDLLIRTGGEKRLSDFLLWESAYARVAFRRLLWPDLDVAAFRAGVAGVVLRRDCPFVGNLRGAGGESEPWIGRPSSNPKNHGRFPHSSPAFDLEFDAGLRHRTE